MHVARNKRSYVAKSGEQRVYESVLVRRTYREGGKVRHETLANLSALPAETVAAVEATLKGERLVPAGQAVTITGSVPHGHVAAVHAMAAKLGLPALLGPAGRARDLALALVISRVVRPGSKLSTLAWWSDTTLGADLGVEQASTDDVYAAMDWLAAGRTRSRRDWRPGTWPRRRTRPGWRCSTCPARGWKARTARWRPAATPGTARRESCRSSTGCSPTPRAGRSRSGCSPETPATRPRSPRSSRWYGEEFALEKMVMVGDRGMITSARIEALNQPEEDGAPQPDPYGWITALRAPAIKKLMADDGPLQLSLFDEQDLAEITSEDFPGERLIACRNPVLAGQRARKREDLLARRPRNSWPPSSPGCRPGRLSGAAKIGVEAGKVVNKYKMGKHFDVAITDDSLTVTRRQAQIDEEAALDGIYVIRTPVPAADLDAPAVVSAYKNLSRVERDFRSIKSDDLDLRPVFHQLEERVKAHVLICMLASYLTWHLRRAWAPLTFTDENPPAPGNPVAPARRSARAQAKASYQHDPAGRPYRSFRGLLGHLATLDPQPGPLRRRQGHRADARRADQRPARGLRPDRRPHPAHREVARTTPGRPGKIPAQNQLPLTELAVTSARRRRWR